MSLALNVSLLMAAMVLAVGAGGCCACRCRGVGPEGTAVPVWRDTRPGATSVTLSILPTGEVYVDGERVEIADLPGILRERDAGDVIFRHEGEPPPSPVMADIVTTVAGSGDYAMGYEYADPSLRR